MRHYEARIKDLEVEIFQQRNLNNELERMLRDLIGKFKKQKNRIKDQLAETSDAKDGLAAYVVEVEKALVEEAEKHVKYKAKAKRHKRKNIKYSDKYSACEKNLMETQAELAFTEDLLEGLTAANVHLYDKLGCANRYIYFCSPTLKNRFKQWWTGIYHIDKLREKL